MKSIIALLCLTAYAGAASVDLFGIKGGHKAKIQDYPYMAAIINSEENQLRGSGLILNKNWILTAATTVYYLSAGEAKVRVGSANAMGGGEYINVKQIKIHEKYTGNWQYDIAVVELAKPIKFSKTMKPITLGNTLPKAGATTTISGFGGVEYVVESDGALRVAQVPFIPSSVCKNSYKSYDFSSQNICASKLRVGACPLDWGGPLVYNHQVIGVFVGSEGDCGSVDFPGVYCDITQFRSWIKDSIRP